MREIDALRTAIESTAGTRVTLHLTRARQILAALEAAREDAARLDWFAADARMNSGRQEHGTRETPALLVNSTRERCTPRDFRIAIDQARGKGVADDA